MRTKIEFIKYVCNRYKSHNIHIKSIEEIGSFSYDIRVDNIYIRYIESYIDNFEVYNKYYLFRQFKLAFDAGIKLIHIYDFEWSNRGNLIESYLNSVILGYNHKIYARDCDVKLIEPIKVKDFINNNHLGGYTPASYALALIYNNNTVGCMTVGKSRFSTDELELVRLCFENNIAIIGGSQKLFKNAIRVLGFNKIISYCDNSKFYGNVYNKLGFTFNKYSTPGYTWVNIMNDKVLTRYQAMKHRLINNGLGNCEMTEEQIMLSIGYTKVYNCGNSIFTWEAAK